MRSEGDGERGKGHGRARPSSGEALGPSGMATAREASSIILLRDSAAGPEVLLVKRNPAQRFMGGAWVFPGGATQDDDGDEVRAGLRELAEEAGIVLQERAELVRFSRWITPAEVDVRFDTHFFVARAPAGAEPAVDGSECVDARWLRPRDALDTAARGELLLVFPTVKHLEQLTGFASVEQALEDARVRRVMPVEPRLLIEGGVAEVVLPGDPRYAG